MMQCIKWCNFKCDICILKKRCGSSNSISSGAREDYSMTAIAMSSMCARAVMKHLKII